MTPSGNGSAGRRAATRLCIVASSSNSLAMSMQSPEQTYLSARLATLAEVRLAYLFGSRARQRERPDSDYDIGVLVEDECVADASGVNRTIRRLAARLAGEIPAQMLHIVLLNDAPPLLRHRVLRDGVLLHARNETERVRFAIRAIREYQDMEPRLAENRRRRLARLREGDRDGRPRGIHEAARSAR